jgi:predicted  nucleic acid-binding Zn-ribbon protein
VKSRSRVLQRLRQLAEERDALEKEHGRLRVELQEAQKELRAAEQAAKDKQAGHDEALSTVQVKDIC